MKTIGITGGTGLIGHYILKLLVGSGYKVTLLTRNPARKSPPEGCTYALFDAASQRCDSDALAKLDAVIHLAGEPVAAKRWTKEQKGRIASSRIEGTRYLVDILKAHAPNCTILIAASAIGYYGADADPAAPFTEDQSPSTNFLADICYQWESEEHQAADFLRTVILRIGIVLAKEGGAFAEFIKPFKFGLKAVLGSGKQIVSWIHIDDLARLFVYALEHDVVRGTLNAVAPNPVSNKTLMQEIAVARGGFYLPAPVPSFVLKIMLGEMSIEILNSCTVSATKTLSTGFSYNYPEISDAVKELIK
jgi:uncharacterized protein